MADQHDTQRQGGGFWGCATTFLAFSVGAFALITGGALIFGGMTRKPPSAATAGDAAASPMAPAPASAPGPAAAPSSAPAPASDPAASSAPPAPRTELPVVEVTIKPAVENPMMYDIKEIRAKAGQKVKITFVNEHAAAPLQHNLLVCKPGSKDRIVAASAAMLADFPKWMAKDLIPDSPDVLHHTKLMNAGEKFVLEFVAGAPGDYPYICTFPGHTLMQGTLKVE